MPCKSSFSMNIHAATDQSTVVPSALALPRSSLPPVSLLVVWMFPASDT